MDFYRIKERITKYGTEVYPDFRICRSKDLMVRGRSFYAIWDEKANLWSTDEYDVQRLVDDGLAAYRDEMLTRQPGSHISVKWMSDFSSSSWQQFQRYVKLLTDNSHQLDTRITFANTEVKKEDYVSKRLVYEISAGGIESYDEVIGTLYDPDERRKLEWSVGAIISGDSRFIQKFIVLHGPAGVGKSTFLGIVESLFSGYIATFEAKSLTSSSNAFSTEVFRHNPLVAIQHDGDLSRIEDNTKLNSIVSHEDMTMNEKFKSSYTARILAFLYMGTNKSVKITDAKSGLIRRLIDVRPSGRLIPANKYHTLMAHIPFELGAIAHHCLEVYRSMGKNYYNSYKPIEMMMQTDVFFNYIDNYWDVFIHQDGVSLSQAYTMYKQYCTDALIEFKLPQYRFREELKNYFEHFEDSYEINGDVVRNYYHGFKHEMFGSKVVEKEETPMSLVLDQDISLLDTMLADMPAQYANAEKTPTSKWANVKTVLSDLDTRELHYTKCPVNHIVIDFDLVDETGQKSLELNMAAANEWPATYAEFSQGGSGIHLHYLWEGDATQLSRIYSEGIEVKVFTGDSSLRRRLSKCNNIPVATISSGLPMKEVKVISTEKLKSEKGLRDMIMRNLRKEVHPGTKSSMDFIKHILDTAYESDYPYDVSDLKSKIVQFAAGSTNQSDTCLKIVTTLKFKKEVEELLPEGEAPRLNDLVVFDCEVFPNLFVVNWKYVDDKNFLGQPNIVRMINPSPEEIEKLARMKLVGFNCRRYDNHILYGRILGYNNEQLYKLSKKIIDNVPRAGFGEAYNLSYADIYDFAATKMGLKKWQIKLGLPHRENEYDWDKPVPEEKWVDIAEYCDNDVISTEAVLHHLWEDYQARLMLAELSDLPVNNPTKDHAARIIFEGNRNPQEFFEYTDLSKDFPGYEFDFGKSTYMDETVGEGGLVRAKPGMYYNVTTLDIASMHPASMVALNIFGKYTKNFKALMDIRLAIKHGRLDEARAMFGGRVAPFIKDEETANALSYALKIIINTVYGLTSATFPNPFRDPRNKDNIVAKRGALFMMNLKKMVEDLGYDPVHIKTDSIKIPDADSKIIDAIMEYGDEWGYTFEHESTYERFCLVNDAFYIALVAPGRKPRHWEAVGAQFIHPYTFKTLFSREKLTLDDLTETKQVSTRMYLDYTPDSDVPMALMPEEPNPEHLHFVGRVGAFVPVTVGGGYLLREKEGKFGAVTGSSGYKWREAESMSTEDWDTVDYRYFNSLADKAVEAIMDHGDFEMFVEDSWRAIG